jgi:acyl-CoA synthetase (NDP forming)
MNANGSAALVRHANLDRLLNPRSIAIVGVSRDGAAAGKMGGSAVLDSLLRGGYRGGLHLVHPDAPVIDGRPSWPSVAAVPETPELVVAALPARQIPRLAEDCAARGVASMVILSAGFSELGTPEGIALERDLGRTAQRSDLRLCGPNGLGFVNFWDGVLCGYFPCLSAGVPAPGGLSLVTHSGAVGNSILARAIDRHVGVGHVISSGNETNLDLAAYVDHLVGDPRVRVIALYMEGASDGLALRRAFDNAAAAGKPVVVYKIGRSDAGAAAALSHTAKVAGRHALYRGLFRQTGVIEATCLDDLIDIPALLLKAAGQGAAAPQRVAVVSISGGLGAIAADHLALEGFSLPPLGEATRAGLLALPIAYGSLANPVDTTAAIHRAENSFGEVVRLVATDPAIDAVVVPNAARFPQTAIKTAQALADVGHDLGKPLLSLWYAGGDNAPAIEILHRSARVASYDDAATCARALAALRDHRCFLADRSAASLLPAENPAAEALSLRREVRAGTLNEPEGKRLLQAFGVRVPRERWVHDVAAAVGAATEIGFPVALKIVSRDVLHKAAVGGVRLGVASEAALRSAWRQMLADLAARAPAASIDGMLVGEMVPIAAELLVGFYRDPTFGPALVVGAGGSDVEALAQVNTCPLPLSRADCARLVDALPDRAMALKARPARDVLVDAVARIAAMALASGPVLAELDVNPLVVTPDGAVVALDAVVRFEE